MLSLSFVFAVTAQEVLGSCIFLFVKHPYDIGDRVDVNNDELTVVRISLLYTNFKRVANGKAVQIPNIVLNNLWIENVTRSRSMREFVTVFVNFGTSFEDIKLLENELRQYVSAKEHARDFQQEVEVSVVDMASMDKLELRVEMRYKGSWHSDAHRASRRSKFLCEIVRVLRQIPIYGPGGGDAPLGSESKPTYSVTVDDDWAARARRKFEEEKDKVRMFPQAEEKDDGDDASNGETGKYRSDENDQKIKGNGSNPFSSAANAANIASNEGFNSKNNRMTDSSTSWSGLSATLTADYHRHANTKENRALELLNHPSPTDDFVRDDALGARGPAYAPATAPVPMLTPAPTFGQGYVPGTGGLESTVGSGASGASANSAAGVSGPLGSSSLTVHPVDQEHVKTLMRRESSRGKRKPGVGLGVGVMEATSGVGRMGRGGIGGTTISEVEGDESEDGGAGRGGGKGGVVTSV